MSVTQFDVVTSTDWDGLSHREARAQIELSDGSGIDVALYPYDGWAFGAEEYLCYEAPGRLTIDGAGGRREL